MSEPILVAEGHDGQVKLFESKIVITRKGLTSKLTHWRSGEKEIPISNITGVQFKDAGRITTGYIQFGQSGYSEADGAFDNAGDENTVHFKRKHQDDFDELRARIDELREQERSGGGGGGGGDSAVETLKKEFAKGEISKEEYEERLEVLEG